MNWKTTTAGIFALLTLAVKLYQGGSVTMEDLMIVGTGLGLIHARDNDK